MRIHDLSYLENIPENSLILGSSALAQTSVFAAAEGDNTYTFAGASTKAKKSRRFSIARGQGTAVAIGEKTTAIIQQSAISSSP